MSQFSESALTMGVTQQDFQPVKVIVLSELSTREKERYYKLLLLNNAKFRRDSQGHFVCNLRLLAPGLRKASAVAAEGLDKKKRDTSNYALIFQDRLMHLKTHGFISVRLQGLPPSAVEAFDYQAYPRFTTLIAADQEAVRPKLRPLAWAMKYIEDIYDHRFAHERHDVERDPEETSSFDLILTIFPVFVVRRLGTNVGLKALVDQTCWDLLFSIHVYRRDYLEVETFARFLQEYYDHDDLLFYLYVRSVVAKVLRVQFKARWSKLEGPGRQAKALWMSFREAAHVARVVFGNDNEELYREFMALVTPQMVGSKTDTTDSRRMDITEYLHLSVVGYHQSQSRHNNSSNNSLAEQQRFLVPLPGQTTPLAPVPVPLSVSPRGTEAVTETEVEVDDNNDNRDNDRELDAADREGDHVYPTLGQKSGPAVAGAGSSRYRNLHVDVPSSDYDHNHHEFDYDHKYDYYDDDDDDNNEDGMQGAGEPLDLYAHDPYGHAPQGLIDAEEDFDEPLLDDQQLQYNDYTDYHDYEGFNDQDQQPQQAAQGTEGPDDLQFALEQLQAGREHEFMSQLCSPLAVVPPTLRGFVEEQLQQRLHETVSLFLEDKDISTLETLDDALLEILQLDQLRVDMEALRDEIVQSLLAHS
jgi:hypothetical protein